MQSVQLVRPIAVQVAGDIDVESEVTAAMESDVLSVDEDGSLVVNSAEIQQYSVSGPARRDGEGRRVP